MGVCVEEVLQLPILKDAKVKTGLFQRRVDWISVIETPVENFVRDHEFVLSTGIGCKEDVDALEEYVKDVIYSRASVIAFAMGRYMYKIPDRILKLAEENQVVMVEIPWEVRFGDILQDVLRLLHQKKDKEQQYAEEIRQELVNCVLNGKGLQDIADILYHHTGIPNAVSDCNQQIRSTRNFDRYFIDVLNGRKQEQARLEGPSIVSDHPLSRSVDHFQIGRESCYQLTIQSNNKTQGYLLFKPKTTDMLTWFAFHILEHALTACALYFVKENAIEMTEIRLKENFLLNLAKQKTGVDKRMLSKASLLGYDLDKPYLCLTGVFEFVSSAEDDFLSFTHQDSTFHNQHYAIKKEVIYAGAVLGRTVMTTFDEQKMIIFLETDGIKSEEAANQFLDLVERRLHERVADIKTYWGISVHKEEMYAFHKSYEEAAIALSIGEQQYPEGGRTFFSDTRMNRLLMALSHKSEINDIVKETLKPLIDYDQKRQTELIHTFTVYNQHNCNVSQTARALNLHRQSLLHRLRNIEHLTGLSLLESDDLFLMELSVRLWLMKKVDI